MREMLYAPSNSLSTYLLSGSAVAPKVLWEHYKHIVSSNKKGRDAHDHEPGSILLLWRERLVDNHALPVFVCDHWYTCVPWFLVCALCRCGEVLGDVYACASEEMMDGTRRDEAGPIKPG